MIKIQLVDTVTGFLDVDQKSNFPINLGLADIRDIAKRNGTFSKTITLIGSKNNNNLLGSIYDVNITKGTFNINKLQKCQVINNGEIILDNLYIQLLSVNKKSNQITKEQEIVYEAVIKDTTGDFFTKINQKELTDLDLNDLSYQGGNVLRLTKSNVESSFTNTAIDGYKYIVPWIDPYRKNSSQNSPANTYQLRELNPGIYAKTYWDRIWANSGYIYTWNSLSDKDIQFDKLILPYNGDNKQMLPEVQEQYKVQLESSTNVLETFFYNNFTDEGGIGKRIYFNTALFNTEIKDLENQYNPSGSGAFGSTGVYTSGLSYTHSDNAVGGELICDFKLELLNNEAVNILTFSANSNFQNNILLSPTWKVYKYNGVTPASPFTNLYHYGDGVTTVIPYGQQYAPGANTLFEGSISINQLINYLRQTGTLSDVQLGLFFRSDKSDNSYRNTPPFVKISDLLPAINHSYRITFSNIRLNYTPALNTVDYRIPVLMNGYVPKKIKQVDFIRSIAQMYNLYFIPDPLDPTNIIIETRDNYYDNGETVDWTNKLNKNLEKNIQFLPELQSKKIILTYKEDKDIANETYKNATNEIYGQQEVEFANEYIKGENKKELIFSPTPVAKTSFDAYLPIINGYNPNSNIRILLDNGSISSNYYIEENGSTLTSNILPLISHFGGDSLQPDFDINYGMCDYYFYNLTETNNNLYNLHWRRTYSQINNGKLLSAYFDLNSFDIKNLKLNQKIWVEDSYWFINKIIDFNATIKTPTKVELISIDDNTNLAPFITREVKQPIEGDGIVQINSDWQIESSNTWSNNTNVNGYNNSISPNTTGNVIGDNNIVNSQYNIPTQISGSNNIIVEGSSVTGNNNTTETSAFIVGSNNTVSPDAINSVILGSNITATDSDTVYTDNIQVSPGSTINGVPIEDIISGTVDVLYSELLNLIITSSLVPDQVYKITDFQTIYDQPDYDSTGLPKTPVTLNGTVQPLYVRAYDNATLYDKVVYYKSNVIDATYNYGWSITEINGSPMKGRITYLKDTLGNESPFDHTEILLKRYETINGSGNYDSYKDTGFGNIDVISINGYDNKCGTNENWNDFWIPNNLVNGYGNSLISNSFNTTIIGDNNILDSYSLRNTLIGNENLIGRYSSDNIVRGDKNTITGNSNLLNNASSNNIIYGNSNTINDGENNEIIGSFLLTSNNNQILIGNRNKIINSGTNILSNSSFNFLNESCANINLTDSNTNTFTSCFLINLNFSSSNIFGFNSNNNTLTNCDYNTFGSGFENNTINPDSYFEYNTFGDLCLNNNLFGSMRHNTFGDKFNSNLSLVGSDFDRNVVGTEVQNCQFNGQQIVLNTIGNGIDTIIFGPDCLYNKIGDSCNNITFIDNNQRNEIASDCEFLTFSINASDNKILQYYKNKTIISNGNRLVFNTGTFNLTDPNFYLTTTNATPTILRQFLPQDGNGVYSIETITTGIDNVTGDTIVSKQFAAFKVIAGVVTQVSTTSTDRKSNFAAAIQTTIDTDGTVIRLRVTGKAATTINWRGHITITN